MNSNQISILSQDIIIPCYYYILIAHTILGCLVFTGETLLKQTVTISRTLKIHLCHPYEQKVRAQGIRLSPGELGERERESKLGRRLSTAGVRGFLLNRDGREGIERK